MLPHIPTGALVAFVALERDGDFVAKDAKPGAPSADAPNFDRHLSQVAAPSPGIGVGSPCRAFLPGDPSVGLGLPTLSRFGISLPVCPSG